MQKLNEIIPIGKANAIHQDKLAEMLGVPTQKAKRIVRQARKEGVEICSSTCGQWIAANDEERKEFVKSMYKQSISRFRTAKAIKRNLNRIQGQQTLFDDDIASNGGAVNEQT